MSAQSQEEVARFHQPKRGNNVKRILLVLAVLTISVTACQRSTGITEPAAPVVTTEEARTQLWIDRIDPFVTDNHNPASGHQYTVDTDGFYQTYGSQLRGEIHGDDSRTVSVLLTNIAIANVQTQESAPTPQGQATVRYWWGSKTCYWGGDAAAIIIIVGAGQFIPGFGGVTYGLVSLMTYYNEQYGGFCLNKNAWWWPGSTVWITKN